MSIPSAQGAWRGEGGACLGGGGRGETLSLGAGEGGELIFSEAEFRAGSHLRGGTGVHGMEKGLLDTKIWILAEIACHCID